MFPDIQQLNSVHERRPFFLPRYFCYLTIMLSNLSITGACVWHLSTGMERIHKWHFSINGHCNSVQMSFPCSVLTLSIFCLRFQWQLFFWQLMLYYIHRSIIGKDICTYCRKPLGIDAKMILDALQIYCHSTCFKVRFHLLPRNRIWLQYLLYTTHIRDYLGLRPSPPVRIRSLETGGED